MDQTAAVPAGWVDRSRARSLPARRLWIRYRAARVRRLTRRSARRPDWIDDVSPWAFWGLHR